MNLVIGKAIFIEFTINLVKVREHIGFRKVGEFQRLVNLKDKLCTVLFYEAFLDVTVLSHEFHIEVESALRLRDEDDVFVNIERYGTGHPLKIMTQKLINLDLFALIFEVLVSIMVTQDKHLKVYEFESVDHFYCVYFVAYFAQDFFSRRFLIEFFALD